MPLAVVAGGVRARAQLFLNRSGRFGRNVDEFDSNADALQAITNFAARSYVGARMGQSKTDVQDGTLWKSPGSIDEHAFCGNIRQAGDNRVAVAFIAHVEIAKARIAFGASHCSPLPLRFQRFRLAVLH